MDLSKLLHGFVKVVTRIYKTCSMFLSPFAKHNQAESMWQLWQIQNIEQNSIRWLIHDKIGVRNQPLKMFKTNSSEWTEQELLQAYLYSQMGLYLRKERDRLKVDCLPVGSSRGASWQSGWEVSSFQLPLQDRQSDFSLSRLSRGSGNLRVYYTWNNEHIDNIIGIDN